MTRFVTGQSALVSSLRCFTFAKFLSFYLFEPHSPSSHMYTHDYMWKYTTKNLLLRVHTTFSYGLLNVSLINMKYM